MKDSKDFIGSLKRQAEILAMCLNGTAYSKADYAGMFNVSEITINRDLEALRERGIQIFSRKKGVRLEDKPQADALIKLAADYLPLKLNSDVFINQIKIFVNNTSSNYFPVLTLLSKAVNEGLIIKMNYTRLYDNKSRDYIIKPIRLNTRELNWVLDGFRMGENIVKSFYVNRINKIALTDEKFTSAPIANDSSDKVEIVLRFHPDVEQQLLGKIFFEDFKLHKDEEGFIILTTRQTITHRLAAWCISWWDMLKILQPAELKNNIKEMIENFCSVNF